MRERFLQHTIAPTTKVQILNLSAKYVHRTHTATESRSSVSLVVMFSGFQHVIAFDVHPRQTITYGKDLAKQLYIIVIVFCFSSMKQFQSKRMLTQTYRFTADTWTVFSGCLANIKRRQKDLHCKVESGSVISNLARIKLRLTISSGKITSKMLMFSKKNWKEHRGSTDQTHSFFSRWLGLSLSLSPRRQPDLATNQTTISNIIKKGTRKHEKPSIEG